MKEESQECAEAKTAMGWLAAATAVVCAVLGATLFLTVSQTNDAHRADAPRVSKSAGEGVKPVRLGLIEFNYSRFNSREIDATISVLRKALHPTSLEAVRYRAEDLDLAVRRGEVDFFVASSGFYYRMMRYGVRSIATITNPYKKNPNESDGASFVVLRDSPIRTIGDMKGKKLAASYPTAFGGYRIAMAELSARGYDYENFFGQTSFVGSPHIHALMHEIITGRADVTIIPACTYEDMPDKERAKYRLVEAGIRGDLKCLSSTIAYPGHTFAALDGVSPEVAKTVTLALLSMRGEDGAEGWSVATDFSKVDEANKVLMIGPYEYLKEPTLRRWVRENAIALSLLLLLVACTALHAWRSDVLVAKRTRQLTEANRERELSSQELLLMNQRMEQMQKVNTIGQLSSMISHEISQPLASILYYAEGAAELLKERDPDRSLLVRCNGKITNEARRAAGIVDRVRSYAKQSASREEPVDAVAVIGKVLHELKAKGIDKAKVTASMPESFIVRGDPLELELLFWNLLKNSLEAALEAKSPRISVKAGSGNGRRGITIRNSGRVLSEEDLQALSSPLTTTKREGIGLGVMIARSIAEGAGGGLTFRRLDEGGLAAVVWFPPEEKET